MKPEILSAISAIIATFMAVISWMYNKELTEGRLSLFEVKLSGRRNNDLLSVDFVFMLKNIGKNDIQIKNIELGHYDFQSNVFENISNPLILNLIYPESIFNYQSSFSINIDKNLNNEEASSALQQISGKHAIIIIVKYKVSSIFYFKTKSLKGYFSYNGDSQVYQLTIDDYDLMRSRLPAEYVIKK